MRRRNCTDRISGGRKRYAASETAIPCSEGLLAETDRHQRIGVALFRGFAEAFERLGVILRGSQTNIMTVPEAEERFGMSLSGGLLVCLARFGGFLRSAETEFIAVAEPVLSVGVAACGSLLEKRKRGLPVLYGTVESFKKIQAEPVLLLPRLFRRKQQCAAQNRKYEKETHDPPLFSEKIAS